MSATIEFITKEKIPLKLKNLNTKEEVFYFCLLNDTFKDIYVVNGDDVFIKRNECSQTVEAFNLRNAKTYAVSLDSEIQEVDLYIEVREKE